MSEADPNSGLVFEWDNQKAALNLQKHRVSFAEAASAFGDALSIVIPDPDHSEEEDRFILLGMSVGQLLVVVVHVEREERIRIISARRATPREREQYEEGI